MADKNRFLLDYRSDVASQFGEDGIIEKIFEILPPSNKWCVEFGAWDGKFMSNTYNLIHSKGWSGVLIDGNPEKLKEVHKTHAGKPVIAVPAFVGWSGKDSLDALLERTEIPLDFDFLSIDIDGNDYHVWKASTKYRPKVVVIEFNPTIPDTIEFVQEANQNVVQGNSILSMVKLAKEKEYELICVNQENAFFADAQYFPLFGIKDNSIAALKYYGAPIQVGQLYDGTLVFWGSQHLFWYGIPFDLNRFQILPKYVRRMNIPWSKQTLFRKLLVRYYRRINRPNKKGLNPWDWKAKY
jgi:hypothetical protein